MIEVARINPALGVPSDVLCSELAKLSPEVRDLLRLATVEGYSGECLPSVSIVRRYAITKVAEHLIHV